MSLKKLYAKGRLKAGQMNQTEMRYQERLELLKTAGEIKGYWFEPMNLKLADNKCFYRVDFMVLTKEDEIHMHEVKGFWTDDALVKIKVAASMFPFRFIAVQYKNKSWIQREF